MTVTNVQALVARLERRGSAPGGRKIRGLEPSRATKRKELGTVRLLYRHLNARGLVSADPCALAVGPKVVNHHPKPVDDAEWLQVWQSAVSKNLPHKG